MKIKFSSKKICAAVIFLVLFAIWTALVINNKLTGFDTAIQSAVFTLRRDWLTAITGPFSYSGNWPVPTVICAVLLIIKKTRKSYGIPLSITALTSVGFYQACKYIIKRARPDKALHLVIQGGYSYTSGHSQTSLMVWGMLILLLCYYAKTNGSCLQIYGKKPFRCEAYPDTAGALTIWKIVLILYIVLMGLSRIYVGVHWPSDVVGGWLLGGLLLTVYSGIFIG